MSKGKKRVRIPYLSSGAVDGRFTAAVAPARMDIATWIETRYALPPVMFSTLDGLQRWAAREEMEIIPVGNSGKLVHVQTRAGVMHTYNQLWVLASWKGYRDDFVAWTAKRAGIEDTSVLESLNADHVVNKASLAAHYFNAWVLLFPVPEVINQGFGVHVERTPPVSPGKASVNLSRKMFFKIMAGHMPATVSELEELMQRCVRGQLLGALEKGEATFAYCDQVHSVMLPIVAKREASKARKHARAVKREHRAASGV